MYSKTHQFEPLIAAPVPPALLEKAADIAKLSLGLNSAAHPSAHTTIRELVRSMNSYYSNRIEGQGTHPEQIDRALRHEFSDQTDIARLQRLARAHIAAEFDLEVRALKEPLVLSSQFLLTAHEALYSRLSEADRTARYFIAHLHNGVMHTVIDGKMLENRLNRSVRALVDRVRSEVIAYGRLVAKVAT